MCSTPSRPLQKASSKSSTAERSPRTATLATSNRIASGREPVAWRNASASDRSFVCLRRVTASKPTPKALPRRDFTSQKTSTPRRSTTRSSSPIRQHQLRATIR